MRAALARDPDFSALLQLSSRLPGFRIRPSQLCGPFREQEFIWNQIPESIGRLPQGTQDFLFFLGSQAFAVPLLLVSR